MRALMIAALLGLLASCQSDPASRSGGATGSGWFPPRVLPSGENAPYWRAGLSGLQIEGRGDVQALPDGSRVFRFNCRPPHREVYLWDRISRRYSSPVVISLDRDLSRYATLDVENLALLEKVHTQLLKVWRGQRSSDEERLRRHLSDAIFDARRSLGDTGL